MSDGITHRKASIILATSFLLGSAMTSTGFDSSVQYMIGSLLGIVMTPDWDVDAGFEFDKTIRKNVGKWAEYIWDGFLWPYRKLFKHGQTSHIPVIGTLTRIIYVYIAGIFIPHVVFYIIVKPEWSLTRALSIYLSNIFFYWKVILGLMGSDFVHWGLDIMTTDHTKKRRK